MSHSSFRALFPPSARPVKSSRLISTRAPPSAAPNRGASSKGVGRLANRTRGKRALSIDSVSIVASIVLLTPKIRVACQQPLHSHLGEGHCNLVVVATSVNADDNALAKLRVLDPLAWPHLFESRRGATRGVARPIAA